MNNATTPANRISVKVTLADGDFWVTGINATIDEARAYFLGVRFEDRNEKLCAPVVRVELETANDPALAWKATMPATAVESREAAALEALANWCWNSEKHLTEARRLLVARANPQHTADGKVCLRQPWRVDVYHLLHTLRRELTHAEPETAQAVTKNGKPDTDKWPRLDVDKFLNAIAEAG